MKYNFLLFDADMTLLDFISAEHEALIMTMAEYGHDIDDEIVSLYSKINDSQWKLFEKGGCTKAELIVNRFRLFLREMGYGHDPERVNASYVKNLACCHPLLPDSLEVCRTLSQTCRMFIITNGVAPTQKKRFSECGLKPYFEKCYISEEIGYQKPMKEFFDFVCSDIEGFVPEHALVIGDSLTSDMQGGVNAGLDTCWFNPSHQPNALNISVTYEISNLNELIRLIK